eukprot:460549-Pleurochrysis_carterae.AAC.1
MHCGSCSPRSLRSKKSSAIRLPFSPVGIGALRIWRVSPQGPQPALEEEAAACEEQEELPVFAVKAGEVEDGCEEALPG